MTQGFKELLSRRIVLVTGKGGVGRSTVTAAAARAAVAAGKRVLVAEMADPADPNSASRDYSPLARIFGLDQLPETRSELAPGIWGTQLVPIKGHELFLQAVFRVGTLARAALHSEALRRLFHAVPSIREIGIFYCLLTALRARDDSGEFLNEIIFVDMPATGHTLALTGLPQVLLSMVPRGPLAEALREGQSFLTDPSQSAAFIVTIPEALPVSETIELVEGLRNSRIHVGGIILNHVPDDPFSPAERSALEEYLDEIRHGGGKLVLGEDRFDMFEQARREIERLETTVDVPVLKLPDAPEKSDALVDLLARELRGQP